MSNGIKPASIDFAYKNFNRDVLPDPTPPVMRIARSFTKAERISSTDISSTTSSTEKAPPSADNFGRT